MLNFVGGILWFFLCGWTALSGGEPDALYLTWMDDPTSTMTVVWQGGNAVRVMYHPLGETRWRATTAEVHQIAETDGKIYISNIEGLKDDATYVFKVEGSTREYKFKTLPKKLSREVRFVVGGDIFYYWPSEALERMNRAVAYDNPDFVILGGDIAYTTGTKRSRKGRAWELDRWQEFFRFMQKSMVTQEGRMVPMIPVVGNHDVHRRSTKRRWVDIFYEVFPLSVQGRAYRALEMGSYLKLVLLDTGHSSPIEGAQAEWLKSTLESDSTPYLFSIYHVGGYPAVYKYKGHIPEMIRTTWVPLFEEAHLSGAFEHHSHALKRTFPIKNGKQDPDGVIYFGDGSWGVPPRKAYAPEDLWYLAMSASVNACWFVHLSKKEATLEARTPTGEVKDRVVLSPRREVK